MKITLIASIATISASVALAGNVETPTVAAAAIAMPSNAGTDWSGLYAGAFYSFASGEDYNIGGPYELNDGNFYGGFAGYRHDLGKIVVGGEVAGSFGADLYEVAFPTWEYTSFIDVKATAGYDMGRVLAYVSAGYTFADFTSGGSDYAFGGWNAGAGLDFMVTNNIFIGGEYVYRSLQDTNLSNYTGDIQSWQIRAGYQF